mmetsp:Transcript_1921/g.11906  ORF Transcript_1921/g.11906 Transcript_1921/m.11906 type:complete len:341 (-) Transcript_1921:1491-2513(-)
MQARFVSFRFVHVLGSSSSFFFFASPNQRVHRATWVSFQPCVAITSTSSSTILLPFSRTSSPCVGTSTHAPASYDSKSRTARALRGNVAAAIRGSNAPAPGALRRKPRVLRRGTRSRRPPLPSAKGARALLSEVRARRGRGRREPGRGKSRRSRDVLAMVQSCGVAAAPAQLPLRADVFRVRRASVRHVRMDERRDHDDVEVGALPTVRRKRIRSSHVGEHAVRQMVARPRRRGGRSRRRASGCARRRNVRRHEPTRWWIRGWMTATLTVHVACTSSGGCGPAQKRGPVPRETTAGLEVDAACMEGPWRESLSTGGRVATWKEEPTGLPRAWTSAWKRVR